MGRIVMREIRYMELELSAEDYEKCRKRKALRDEMELNPKPTRHELSFAEKLEKCPFCGKTPRYNKICTKSGRYSYKMNCGLHDRLPGNIFPLDCGDWFKTPSRAGRDWNERVRKARMDKHACEVYTLLECQRKMLTRQQLRTLKGQIFAGDADGAMRGLERILAQQKRDKNANTEENRHENFARQPV